MVTAAALAEVGRRGYRTELRQSSTAAANPWRTMGFEDTFAYGTFGLSSRA